MRKTIWVVIEVESGIPALVEAFGDEGAAERRADDLRADINPEDDEVAVFEVTPQ